MCKNYSEIKYRTAWSWLERKSISPYGLEIFLLESQKEGARLPSTPPSVVSFVLCASIVSIRSVSGPGAAFVSVCVPFPSMAMLAS